MLNLNVEEYTIQFPHKQQSFHLYAITLEMVLSILKKKSNDVCQNNIINEITH